MSAPDAADPKPVEAKRPATSPALVEADLNGPLKGNNDKGDQQRIKRRGFLCRTIGAFTIPDSAPLLAKLANIENDPLEVEVRFAALEGLATLAKNVGPENLRKD